MRTKVSRTEPNSETAAVVVVYVNEAAPATVIRMEDLSTRAAPLWRARAYRVLVNSNEYVGEAVADTADEAERRCRKLTKFKRGVHDVRRDSRQWEARPMPPTEAPRTPQHFPPNTRPAPRAAAGAPHAAPEGLLEIKPHPLDPRRGDLPPNFIMDPPFSPPH